MPEERRQFPRLDARLVTWVKVLETGKVQRSLTTNLGGVGLCVTTEWAYAPGTPLAIEVHLPDRSAPVRCQAEVVWSTPQPGSRKSFETPLADTGIKFTQIHPKDCAAILQYAQLNALPPEPPRA